MLFKDLDLGPDDAKGDARLSEYFIRTPEYEHVRSGEATFVIGRKGTGKTAICQMIHDEAQNSATMFCALLSFKNAPSNALFRSIDQGYTSPNQYISIWKFLIAFEAAKLILNDESIDNETREELRSFLEKNFGNSEVGALDAVAILQERSWKVSLKLPLKYLDVPGGEVVRSTSDASNQQIHFGRAATALMNRIASIQSENTFFIIFDELDEDYKITGVYFDLIISLFKATYQIRREIPTTLALRPVVVLREDIFLQLDDHDLNKVDDLMVRLRWQTDPTTREFGLRGLIEQRFRANVRSAGITQEGEDLWSQFVDEAAWGGPYSTIWEFFTLRTMGRPRDIIKGIKCCQTFEHGPKLGPEAIGKSLRDYSDWLCREIGNEIFRVMPHYREAMGLLTMFGAQPFNVSMWHVKFSNNEVLSRNCNADDILHLLYEFGVIGMAIAKKRQNWVFKYTHPQMVFNLSSMFVVHPGLYDFLAVPHAPVISKARMKAEKKKKKKEMKEKRKKEMKKKKEEEEKKNKCKAPAVPLPSATMKPNQAEGSTGASEPPTGSPS